MDTNNKGTQYHPFIKFILIIVIGSIGFLLQSQLAAFIPCLIFSGLLFYSRDSASALGLLIGSITLVVGTQLLLDSSNTAFHVFAQATEAFRKVLLMVMGGRLFYKTTEITDLIKALEQLKVPNFIVLPLAVTLRFIPSLRFEFAAIKDAMRVRGIPVGIKGFFRHPKKQLEYLLVPLLMRSVCIADELSASCITRGINSIHKKTSYKSIEVKVRDYVLFLVGILVSIGVLILDVFMM